MTGVNSKGLPSIHYRLPANIDNFNKAKVSNHARHKLSLCTSESCILKRLFRVMSQDWKKQVLSIETVESLRHQVFFMNSARISSNTPNNENRKKEKSKSQKCNQIRNIAISDIHAPVFSSRLSVAIS